MNRKIVRYLGIAIPLIYGLAITVMPVSRWLFGHDIRYCTISNTRTQKIALYNGDESTAQKIGVQINIKSTGSRSLSDFDFAGYSGDFKRSFFKSFANSEVLSTCPLTERNRIIDILDEHSDRQTLYDLDESLNMILTTRLTDQPDLKTAIGELQKKEGSSINWHSIWGQKCRGKKAASEKTICQKMEALLENWEYFRRELQFQALKEWKQETGVDVVAPGGVFGFVTLLHFDVPVKERDASYLEIHFGPDELSFERPTIFAAGRTRLTEVADMSDLNANSLWIYFKYHMLLVLLLGIIFLFLVWAAYFINPPVSLYPIHKVFNLALESEDHELWTIAFERYRYFVAREFRYFRAEFRKPNLQYDSEEILDFLRRKLTDKYNIVKKEYGRKVAKYDSEEELNMFTRNLLKFYVLSA